MAFQLRVLLESKSDWGEDTETAASPTRVHSDHNILWLEQMQDITDNF